MSRYSNSHPDRRRKLLIESGFQVGFLIHTLSGALLSSAVFYVANRLFFWKFADYGRQAGFSKDHIFFKFLETQIGQMNQIFVGTTIFVCALLIAYGLVYSNRVAGPIYHLRKYLRNYARGKSDHPIHLRETDHFADLAPLINDALRAGATKHEKKAS